MSIPYNWFRGPDGARLFHTDHGLTYRVYFLDGSRYFSAYPEFSHLVQSFGFEIWENPQAQVPHDARVRLTITFIVLQYFEQNPEGILFFVYDDSDGKAQGRHKKFDHWYRGAGESELIKRDATIAVGRSSITASILLRVGNSRLERTLEAFEQIMLEASTKPEEDH